MIVVIAVATCIFHDYYDSYNCNDKCHDFMIAKPLKVSTLRIDDTVCGA